MPKLVYFWFGISLALMAAETFMPGAFLLWFGFAAGAMGLIVYVLPGMTPIAQAITFGVLSFISLAIYRRWFRGREPKSDQPLLNKRVDQMLGRTYELHEPIRNGYGKIKVNDALWTVEGSDLPAGTRVTVTGSNGMTLTVTSA